MFCPDSFDGLAATRVTVDARVLYIALRSADVYRVNEILASIEMGS